MWEEKQAEAAELVEKLKSTSEALAQQIALIASRLGLTAPRSSDCSIVGHSWRKPAISAHRRQAIANLPRMIYRPQSAASVRASASAAS